jgi:hypothetical protein
MGKKVEEALLGYTVAQARAAGADHVTAPPTEGPRNAPAREFFAAKFADPGAAAIDPERVGIPSLVTVREEN